MWKTSDPGTFYAPLLLDLEHGCLYPLHLFRKLLFADDPLVVQKVDQGSRLNDHGHEQFLEANSLLGIKIGAHSGSLDVMYLLSQLSLEIHY
jgi:hypothetical protein